MSLFKDLTNEQFLSGLMLGAVFTLLTVLGIDKMFNKNVPMYTTVSAIVPTDVIDAYNKGIEDALETNPTNAQLEDADLGGPCVPARHHCVCGRRHTGTCMGCAEVRTSSTGGHAREMDPWFAQL